MIGKIKCFFGFHDFGDWIFLGYIIKENATKSARLCGREGCAAVETLLLRKDK
jgi:hypothetical protein